MPRRSRYRAVAQKTRNEAVATFEKCRACSMGAARIRKSRSIPTRSTAGLLAAGTPLSTPMFRGKWSGVGAGVPNEAWN
jgi:hypothetical protein